MRLPTHADETEVALFNPHPLKDFTFKFTHEDNIQRDYTLPAYRVTRLPKYLADRFAAQMADQLVQIRGVKHNYQQDKEEILKEIYVT